MIGNKGKSSLTITVGTYCFIADHNINKIFDRNITSGYVHIWKNTHKIRTCLSYGTIIYFNFAVQIISVNLWFLSCSLLTITIWISQNNEGKVTTLCRNSNHLMPRKYHKGRDFILKIICKTKYKCIKEQYHGNRNYKYENVTMCCVYILITTQ